MCGFLVCNRFEGLSTLDFEEALALQSHRGPDNTKVVKYDSVWMGFNRLSIIDLSSAANQPIGLGQITHGHFKVYGWEPSK